MRRGALGFVFASMLVVLCPAAGAQIVRWTDERGEVHITEGTDSVPERYRGSVEVLTRSRPPEPESGDHEPKMADTPQVASGMASIRFQPGEPIMAIARINSSAVVTLMIDTGASITTLSPSVVKALGLDLREAPTLAVGPPGQGLIGQDFLRHFSMSMDNRTGILTLWAR